MFGDFGVPELILVATIALLLLAGRAPLLGSPTNRDTARVPPSRSYLDRLLRR